MTPPQRITATPNPVETGKGLTVCYEFTSDSPDSVILTFDWSPDAVGDYTKTVSREDPCVTVTVPDNATSLVVSGPDSADRPVTID